WAPPVVPSPADLTWCLNTVYFRNGEDYKTLKRFDIADVLPLMFKSDSKAIATKMLSIILSNASTLLWHSAMLRAQCLVCTFGGRQLRMFPSVLGLLLSKTGFTENRYMDTLSFNIGRMFSL